MDPNTTWAPLTSDEVGRAKVHWKNAAPGLDRVSVAKVKSFPNVTLAVVLNLIMLSGIIPTSFRTIRLILLHKSGSKRSPGNWRPITIASAIQRLHHRALAGRLRDSVNINVNQRGFTNLDGTLANITILEAFITGSKASNKTSSLIFLDVAAAFDTVSHHAIDKALAYTNIDPITRHYIMESITGVETIVKIGSNHSQPIPIQRGVRQGDLLSPLLFNLTINELLNQLNNGVDGGFLEGGAKVAAMAFADDLVLLHDDPTLGLATVTKVENYLNDCGMKLNPRKCATLTNEKIGGRLMARSTPIYEVAGHKIAQISAVNPYRYLGHDLNASSLLRPSVTNLPVWLNRLEKAPLKTAQKFLLLKQFIVPKIFYLLQSSKTTYAMLRSADGLIKKTAKRVLHLSTHTPDCAILTRIRDGALGLMDLAAAAPFTLASRLENLVRHSEDATLQAALSSTAVMNLRQRLLQHNPPNHPSQSRREQITNNFSLKGLELACDDQASRGWIDNPPPKWSGRDYIRAIQLRTNNLPTKALPYVP